MACGDDLKTLLSRYVDGELSPEERARVEEHTAGALDAISEAFSTSRLPFLDTGF